MQEHRTHGDLSSRTAPSGCSIDPVRPPEPAFLPGDLSLQQLSDLLAAGFGGKCLPNWGRGAPSAHRRQEVTVIAVLPDGAYRYDAKHHRLELFRQGDFRSAAGARDTHAEAPVHLMYVVDIDALEQAHAEERGVLVGDDAGCIVENVHRYCAGAGLATLLRGRVVRTRLAQALELKPTQRVVLAQVVGHPGPPRSH